MKNNSAGEDVRGLLQRLRAEHGDVGVVSSALSVVPASDADVLEPLLDCLGDDDANLRVQAATLLGTRGDARAIDALIPRVSDADRNVRFAAIEALGKLRARPAVEAIAAIAGGGDFYLAYPALEALAQIGDARAVVLVTPLLEDADLRTAAIDVLRELGGDEAIPPLARLLNDGRAPAELVAAAFDAIVARSDARGRSAAMVEHEISDAGTRRLTETLPIRPDPAAVRTSREMGSVLRVLSWCAGDDAAAVLGPFVAHPAAGADVAAWFVRRAADRHSRVAVDRLVEQLGSDNVDLAAAAAAALGRTTRVEAFEPLMALLRHPDGTVHHAATRALMSLAHPDMRPAVATLLLEPDAHVREAAVRIAGHFKYPEIVDTLLERCADPAPGVRAAALEQLPALDDPRAMAMLCRGLDEAEPQRVRCIAAQALGRIRDEAARLPLVRALSDPDPWVRYFAAGALAERRDHTVVTDLGRLAQEDPAPQVRLAAIHALGAIGGAAAPLLSMLSRSTDPEPAAAARRALESCLSIPPSTT